MTDQRSIELDSMLAEFLDVFRQTLGLPLVGSGIQGGMSMGSPASFELYLPEVNSEYLDTDYFLKLKDPKKLLHFTSLPKLYSIINDGSIRLYNLNNSTDPNEYQHVASNLLPVYKFFDEKFDHASYSEYLTKKKESLFILSCTETKEKCNPDFWKKFGDDYKGVAIEFEIINNPEKWSSFYFAKVKYGLEFSELTKFFSCWKKLHRVHPYNKYLIDLKQLIAFHKDNLYTRENEIRILTMPFKHSKHVDLYRSCTFTDAHRSCSGQIVKYFKMPLCDSTGNYINNQWSSQEFHNDFIDHAPKLRISNVYFGPNFPDFRKVVGKLKIYMYEKLKCIMPDFQNNQIRL